MNDGCFGVAGHALLKPRHELVHVVDVFGLARLVLLRPATEVPLHEVTSSQTHTATTDRRACAKQ